MVISTKNLELLPLFSPDCEFFDHICSLVMILSEASHNVQNKYDKSNLCIHPAIKLKLP